MAGALLMPTCTRHFIVEHALNSSFSNDITLASVSRNCSWSTSM